MTVSLFGGSRVSSSPQKTVIKSETLTKNQIPRKFYAKFNHLKRPVGADFCDHFDILYFFDGAENAPERLSLDFDWITGKSEKWYSNNGYF